MTPDREARLRLDLASAIKCDVPNCHNYACVTAELLAELDALRREYRQFLADLGSTVAGMPVEPGEALRRVEELVRLRETGRSST